MQTKKTQPMPVAEIAAGIFCWRIIEICKVEVSIWVREHFLARAKLPVLHQNKALRLTVVRLTCGQDREGSHEFPCYREPETEDRFVDRIAGGRSSSAGCIRASDRK